MPRELYEILNDAAASLGLVDLKPLIPGGQKLVYTAKLNHVDVVLKLILLPKDPDAADRIRERAHREVELLSEIDSDRVVRMMLDAVEIGDPPDAVCWAEELLGGDDLQAHMTIPWSEDMTVQLLADIGQALAACHELAVIHRDLSPGNVRRLPNGRFVLMDPGLARHLEKEALTGFFQPGTRGYRSPEHTPGGKPIPASDVFGLGILAFRMLTGTLPIDPMGRSEDEYNRILLYGNAPKLSASAASPPLCELVDRCLQRQPARRFIDAFELLETLTKSGLSWES